MRSTLNTFPMAGTLQTLILTPPSPQTLSFRLGTPRFPPNHGFFYSTSITFNHNRSIYRPIRALERSDEVRPSLIPSVSITCFFCVWLPRKCRKRKEITVSDNFENKIYTHCVCITLYKLSTL
jgi:hypothetical protein